MKRVVADALVVKRAAKKDRQIARPGQRAALRVFLLFFILAAPSRLSAVGPRSSIEPGLGVIDGPGPPVSDVIVPPIVPMTVCAPLRRSSMWPTKCLSENDSRCGETGRLALVRRCRSGQADRS